MNLIFKAFAFGVVIGNIIPILLMVLLSTEPHKCNEKEYKDALCKCNSERAKVREILKGDSLKTLLYW